LNVVYHVIVDGFQNIVTAAGGRVSFLLYAICIGALGFLNTWDIPIYFAVMGLVLIVWYDRNDAETWLKAIFGMVSFAIICIMLYLPFYISFQSQAGGILPNLWNPTHLPQFFVFFGPFLVAIAGYLIIFRLDSTPYSLSPPHTKWTLPLMIFTPIVVSVIIAGTFIFPENGQMFIQGILRDPNVQTVIGGASQDKLIQEIITRRLKNPWTFFLLSIMLAWGLARWWNYFSIEKNTTSKAWSVKASLDQKSQSHALPRQETAEMFTLILLMIGLLLPLTVEFIYLKDNFGTRMNTVFKFYFQAWILLALASAFGVYYVNQWLKGVTKIAWQLIMIALIAGGMVYPILATFHKANNFQNEATLDGIAWISKLYPFDYKAIAWINANTPTDAIILEKTAGHAGYKYEGRISALTGRGTLLGWGNHESQWRGNYDEPGKREPDITNIYNTLDINLALALLNKYNVDYVYVGLLESQAYSPAGLAKFDKFMDVVFQEGDVIIYAEKWH